MTFRDGRQEIIQRFTLTFPGRVAGDYQEIYHDRWGRMARDYQEIYHDIYGRVARDYQEIYHDRW